MRFEGKAALVTGASRGIGRAIAVHLAREGAQVLVNFQKNESAAQASMSGGSGGPSATRTSSGWAAQAWASCAGPGWAPSR